jgi:hypothetical protein
VHCDLAFALLETSGMARVAPTSRGILTREQIAAMGLPLKTVEDLHAALEQRMDALIDRSSTADPSAIVAVHFQVARQPVHEGKLEALKYDLNGMSSDEVKAAAILLGQTYARLGWEVECVLGDEHRVWQGQANRWTLYVELLEPSVYGSVRYTPGTTPTFRLRFIPEDYRPKS